MNIQEWTTLFFQQVKETPPLQWIGVSFGILEVFLAKANKVWLYPAGIISTSIATFTLFKSGLFAESTLNIYYLVMSIYGWIIWYRHQNKAPLSTTFASSKDWGVTAAIVASSFLILYFVLSSYTSSDVPVWDSWVSATAWAGMWLLAKRKVENWILLNISNAFAIPLLVQKDLALYGILTTVLFLVAIQGYFSWKKTARIHQQQSNN